MKRIVAVALIAAVCCLASCRAQGTRSQSQDTDYRKDQASRQVKRDMAREKKEPIDTHQQDRQDIIDQPL